METVRKPGVHWEAIDTAVCLYSDLKGRRVVAQGWVELGDIAAFIPLVRSKSKRDKAQFIKEVDELERVCVPDPTGAGTALYGLLRIEAGDIVVAIEGTKVRGFCRVDRAGVDSYVFDNPQRSHYAHEVGDFVTWVDWDAATFGFTPRPPRLGVRGVTRLREESDRVIEAWALWGQMNQLDFTDGQKAVTRRIHKKAKRQAQRKTA